MVLALWKLLNQCIAWTGYELVYHETGPSSVWDADAGRAYDDPTIRKYVSFDPIERPTH